MAYYEVFIIGGGVKSSQARFSIKRQQKLADKAIIEAGKQLGIDLSKDELTNVKVVNEKNWDQPGAAAFYRTSDDTLYIRRKFFTRLNRDTIIHENLHGRSGENFYSSNLGRILEEGTTDYLTNYTVNNSFRTKGKKFSQASEAYPIENNYVTDIMTIIGREKYIKHWKTGLRTNHRAIANELESKGYKDSARLIRSEYLARSSALTTKDEVFYRVLTREIKINKFRNYSLSEKSSIDIYDKKIEKDEKFDKARSSLLLGK